MFDLFSRIKHDLESIARRYSQFIQVNVTKEDQNITLILTPVEGVDWEAFVYNANDYIKKLSELHLIVNTNKTFVITPTIYLKTNKKEIEYNNIAIDLTKTKIVYNYNQLTWELNTVKVKDNSCFNIAISVDTLIKFLKFLDS